MLYKNGKIADVFTGPRKVAEIYLGDKLVWKSGRIYAVYHDDLLLLYSVGESKVPIRAGMDVKLAVNLRLDPIMKKAVPGDAEKELCQIVAVAIPVDSQTGITNTALLRESAKGQTRVGQIGTADDELMMVHMQPYAVYGLYDQYSEKLLDENSTAVNCQGYSADHIEELIKADLPAVLADCGTSEKDICLLVYEIDGLAGLGVAGEVLKRLLSQSLLSQSLEGNSVTGRVATKEEAIICYTVCSSHSDGKAGEKLIELVQRHVSGVSAVGQATEKIIRVLKRLLCGWTGQGFSGSAKKEMLKRKLSGSGADGRSVTYVGIIQRVWLQGAAIAEKLAVFGNRLLSSTAVGGQRKDPVTGNIGGHISAHLSAKGDRKPPVVVRLMNRIKMTLEAHGLDKIPDQAISNNTVRVDLNAIGNTGNVEKANANTAVLSRQTVLETAAAMSGSVGSTLFGLCASAEIEEGGTWDVEEDGSVLILRQVYDVTENGNILEVM